MTKVVVKLYQCLIKTLFLFGGSGDRLFEYCIPPLIVPAANECLVKYLQLYVKIRP